jgi:hypothetical protein
MSEHGEVILFVTRASFAQHLANLEAEGENSDSEDDETDAGPAVVPVQEGAQMDRDAAVEANDDEEATEPTVRHFLVS